MAITSFKKTMETILNMKCIVMVIFSYILSDGSVYTVYWEGDGFKILCLLSLLPWRMF